jgi:Zn-dependent protease
MGAIHIFTLAGVPVFISLWYLLLVAFFAMGAGSLPVGVLIGLCVTASLLAHEFGHAMVARHFRLSPQVLLHGWGGLCAHTPPARERDNALILAAGPGAGLALALAMHGLLTLLLDQAPETMWTGEGFNATRSYLHFSLALLVDINVVWSLLNLIPLWPLDGGQLLRLALLRVRPPQQADPLVHRVGIGLAAVGIAYALSGGMIFMAIIAALLGWENYQRLDLASAARGTARGAARRKGGPGSVFATTLLAEAEAAFQMEDWPEAVRLSHQLRDQGGLSDSFLQRALVIIVVANVAQGEHQDALDFAAHAPDTPEVREAVRKARAALGQPEPTTEGAPSPTEEEP